jgi:hypothetical protein
MKSLVLLSFLFFSLHGQAQVPGIPGAANIGGLLKQLVGGIQPSAFTSAFSKDSWLSKAAKSTDVPTLAKNISALAGFIKPGFFKQTFSLKNLQNLASSAKTMGDASSLLKNLEGGLKPEAVTSDWTAKRSGWTQALDLIK